MYHYFLDLKYNYITSFNNHLSELAIVNIIHFHKKYTGEVFYETFFMYIT